MAFVKNSTASVDSALPYFSTREEAIVFFERNSDLDKKSYAIDEIVKFDGGASFLVDRLISIDVGKELLSHIGATLSKLDPKKAPIEQIMELLKINNAYVRNLAISILQDYGESIRYYIVKFLIGDDPDLRIFAINVLGDVNFSESREMLAELLQTEENLNVAMTAVDYMGEIGEIEDIDLLKKVADRFKDEPYVQFGVEGAIKSIEG